LGRRICRKVFMNLMNLKHRSSPAFRRFRVTYLRDQSVPEDILRFWIGYADKSVSDRYSKMKQRINSRKEWAEKVGVGFSCPAPMCTHFTEMKNAA
jgi:hypothetical protein